MTDLPDAIARIMRQTAVDPTIEQPNRDAEKLKKWRDAVTSACPFLAAEIAMGDHVLQTPALVSVASWLKNPRGKHLMIRGSVGSGKSVAAAFALRYWLEPGMSRGVGGVSWLSPDDVVSGVLHSYDQNAPKIGRRVVIDDLGTETKADFQHAFEKLLDRTGVQLLVTTNLRKADFVPPAYAPRLVSRLRGTMDAADVPGVDLRGSSDDF